jgi:hypothetical protein
MRGRGREGFLGVLGLLALPAMGRGLQNSC